MLGIIFLVHWTTWDWTLVSHKPKFWCIFRFFHSPVLNLVFFVICFCISNDHVHLWVWIKQILGWVIVWEEAHKATWAMKKCFMLVNPVPGVIEKGTKWPTGPKHAELASDGEQNDKDKYNDWLNIFRIFPDLWCNGLSNPNRDSLGNNGSMDPLKFLNTLPWDTSCST